MKFRPFRFIKNTGKSFVDIPRWFGAKHLKDTTSTLTGLAKPLFKKEEKRSPETFEEARRRFRLSDEDLKKKQQGLMRQLMVYGVSSLLLSIYMVYLLLNGHLYLGVIVIFILALLGVKAYKAHLYFYQIQHRKLGVTFKEWLQSFTKKGADS